MFNYPVVYLLLEKNTLNSLSGDVMFRWRGIQVIRKARN